jgi:Protein of unknown function (DUF445)
MRELKSIRKAPNAMALDRSDLASLWELKRTKLVAGAVLVASLAVLIIARLLERHDPRFGFLAAFAEAAMIGGLAIGTPSLSRPFGLPIPHTAIIPANHRQIAERLGGFIETHFLAPGVSTFIADQDKAWDMDQLVRLIEVNVGRRSAVHPLQRRNRRRARWPRVVHERDPVAARLTQDGAAYDVP